MVDQKRSFAHHTLAFSQRLFETIPRPNIFSNVKRYVVSPLYRAARFMRFLWNETAVYEMPSGSDISPITDVHQQQWFHGDINNDGCHPVSLIRTAFEVHPEVYRRRGEA